MTVPENTRDQADKLWEYRLYLGNTFYTRFNLFLVSESMVLVAFTILLSTARPDLFVVNIIGALGILLTLVWLCVNKRQLEVINHVRKEVEAAFPDIQGIRQERPPGKPGSTRLLAYGVPLIILATWIALIMAVLGRSV